MYATRNLTPVRPKVCRDADADRRLGHGLRDSSARSASVTAHESRSMSCFAA